MSEDVPTEEKPVRLRKDGKPFKKRTTIIQPAHRAILADMVQGKTITEAMIAQSYAPSVVDTPKRITNTDSWAALMEEFLPEDKVAMRHAELLDKRDVRIDVFGRGKKRHVERTDLGPNVPAVGKALEMAYKLRGAFKAEAPPPAAVSVYNLFYQPHIQARVHAFEDAIKDAIAHEIVATDTGASTSHTQPATDTGGNDAGQAA